MQRLCGWREHYRQGMEGLGSGWSAERKDNGATCRGGRACGPLLKARGKEWGGHEEYGKKRVEPKLIAYQLYNLDKHLSLPSHVSGFQFIHNGGENYSPIRVNHVKTPTTLV